MRPGALIPLPADSLPDTMGFKEFVTWSKDVALAMPNVRVLCETRLSFALREIRPTVAVPSSCRYSAPV